MSLKRKLIKEKTAVLKLLRALLWALTVRPKGFGVRVQVSEEMIGMSKVFTYRQGLMPVKPGVASQRLVVSVDGVEQSPVLIAGDATEVEFKAGPEGATVVLSLDYLDTRGNDSGNFESTFTVEDKVAPEAPVGFGDLTQVAEEDDGT